MALVFVSSIIESNHYTTVAVVRVTIPAGVLRYYGNVLGGSQYKSIVVFVTHTQYSISVRYRHIFVCHCGRRHISKVAQLELVLVVVGVASWVM